MSYRNITFTMRQYLGEHWCLSSTFFIALLNGTCFFLCAKTVVSSGSGLLILLITIYFDLMAVRFQKYCLLFTHREESKFYFICFFFSLRKSQMRKSYGHILTRYTHFYSSTHLQKNISLLTSTHFYSCIADDVRVYRQSMIQRSWIDLTLRLNRWIISK